MGPADAGGFGRLVLVRHSLPDMEPDSPAASWRLSEEGERRCGPLAEALRPHAPRRVVTSEEPKAARTGELVAERLGIPAASTGGLEEQDRRGVAWFDSQEAYRAAVREVLFRPDERVLGRESGREAGERFAAAVEGVLGGSGSGETGPVVIVAHGTVMSLYAAGMGAGAYDAETAWKLWRRLTMPSLMVLQTPSRALLEVRVGIGEPAERSGTMPGSGGATTAP